MNENIFEMFFILTIFSLLGGLCYRIGGMGKEDNAKPRFVPISLRNTKMRDFGIPILMLILMTILHGWHWSLVLCFGLMFGSQTSYFKKKGTDSKWYNWLFVGLAFSVSLLPYTIQSGHWLGFVYRAIVVTAITILWSEIVSVDWIEEGGRGFIQIITLSLL